MLNHFFSRRALWGFCMCLILITSCSNDDEPLPAYRQNLAELFTDGDGYASKFVADNDDTLGVANAEEINRLVPDTIYRVKATFLKQVNKAQILSMQSIFSMTPLSQAPSNISHDAISIDGVWRAGRYLNVLVSFKTSGAGKHSLAFVEEGITTGPDGTKMLHVALLHSRNGDGENFTRQDYLSCIVDVFSSQLQVNRDSITLTYPSTKGTLEKHLAF